MYALIYMCIFVYICRYTYKYKCMHTGMYMYIYKYVYMLMYIIPSFACIFSKNSSPNFVMGSIICSAQKEAYIWINYMYLYKQNTSINKCIYNHMYIIFSSLYFMMGSIICSAQKKAYLYEFMDTYTCKYTHIHIYN
jgi:hypothetical protein